MQAYRGPKPNPTKIHLKEKRDPSWFLKTRDNFICIWVAPNWNRESILFVYAQQNEFTNKKRKQDIWLEEANLYEAVMLIFCNHNNVNGQRWWLMIIMQLKYLSMKQCSSQTFSCPCHESPSTHAHCSSSACWSYRSSLLFDQVFPLCKQRYSHLLPWEPTWYICRSSNEEAFPYKIKLDIDYLSSKCRYTCYSTPLIILLSSGS